MTPERHQRVKRLFLAAAELAAPEAECFLDNACAGDPSLRQEVQTLLDHHTEQTFLPTEPSGERAATATELAAASGAARLESEGQAALRPPGTIIAGRYRLVAPLGQGGMGVVYRAEDLELDQTVALKFLHPRLTSLEPAINWLRREVRVSRQITHQNVVRVFDLGLADGEVFLSMEFIAGEDLGALVRRAGRLNPDKLRDVGRQLAAGLAAAHDAGILHRDLKPANIMLDAGGDVRILDFGIAAAKTGRDAAQGLAGTPGFIAPELLAGQPPSRQCDLYAWGLVLYYAATGNLPSSARGQSPPTEPLAASGVDRELTRLILTCLAPDPAARPKSAHELVAALSPIDPLRTEVDAGRVPPPDMLLAACSWRPAERIVHTLLAGGLLLLVLIMLLADRMLFLTRCGLTKSPEALRDRAEGILSQLGHSVPGPVLTGISLDTNCLQKLRDEMPVPNYWQRIRAAEIPAIFYWYRRGDPRLPRPAPLGDSTPERMAEPTPGTATIRLDGRGMLLSLQVEANAPSMATSTGQPGAANWQALFDLAGLKLSDFEEISTRRWPPLYADEVHTWQGPAPYAAPGSGVSLTVSGAAHQGRVVFFDVDQPWEQSRAYDAIYVFNQQTSRFVSVRTALCLIASGLAAALAWLNVRQGHADWLGAWRVALCVMLLALVHWLLGARHTLQLGEELSVGFLWLNVIVFLGAIAGVAYLAIEPLARRWWPWSLITLRHLLAGRFGDRDIWADVLLGIVIGLVCVLLRGLSTLLTNLLALPVSGLNDFDLSQDLVELLGLRFRAAVCITALLRAIIDSLLLLALVVLLKRLLKSTLAAAVTLALALAVVEILSRGLVSPFDCLSRTLLWAVTAWLLVRQGVLATIAALATFYTVNNTPITLDFAAWYAPTSLFVLAIVALALLACWRLALPQSTAVRLQTGPS